MDDQKKMRSCFSNIPTDIILENILTRVPAKSLMRFKLVCKQWQITILHDHRFHESHRRFSPSRPSILAFVGTYYPLSSGGSVNRLEDYYNYPTKSLKVANRFVCSSIPSSDSISANWKKKVWGDYYTTEVVNSIFCVYSKYSENIYLCNLSTRETMKVPPPPGWKNYKFYDLPCCYYLGFDELNNIYKLLNIKEERYSISMDDEFLDNYSKILTLGYNQTNKQDCWRNTSPMNSVRFHQSYCFKSALYWIVQECLVCYDLGKESYSLIQYPHAQAFPEPTFCAWNHEGRYFDCLEFGLTQIGGRLALTHSYVEATEFNIWVLDNSYEQKWDKITIHIPIHLRDPFAPSFLATVTPGGGGTNNKKILFTIGRTMYKTRIGFRMRVYSYDLESETWETLDNDYLPADVAVSVASPTSSSSIQAAYTNYSQIYYFYEDNILPLKDILAPK